VDAGQIGQVIGNLVLNAREAMPEGGVVSIFAENVVLKSNEVPGLPPGDHIRISITDQGGGIAKEVLPKIFDPYFSTKRRGPEKGMGLGLTICHTIIRKHGGAIVVQSEAGTGTTFHIHLPACHRPPGQAKPPAATVRSRPGKILVMDDEVFLRKLVEATLQRIGHEVQVVADGREALEAYARARSEGHPFDLVLLDMTIPGGPGGQDVLRELLKLDPTVKALAMSGYSEDPAMLDPGRHGFHGMIPKPFVSAQMRDIITQAMGARPSA
jgi:CheY-like chemotaxis protein